MDMLLPSRIECEYEKKTLLLYIYVDLMYKSIGIFRQKIALL